MGNLLQEIERLVDNGANLLDSKVPGWYNQIKLSTLNVGLCSRCIVGQLFYDYDEGLKSLGLDTFEKVQEHGFEGLFLLPAEYEVKDVYSLAQEIWVNAILKRREDALKNSYLRHIARSCRQLTSVVL